MLSMRWIKIIIMTFTLITLKKHKWILIPKASLFISDLLEHICVSCPFCYYYYYYDLFFTFLGLDHQLYLAIVFAYGLYLQFRIILILCGLLKNNYRQNFFYLLN